VDGDNDIHHHQRLGRVFGMGWMGMVAKFTGWFGHGVSVNKPATCSATKINICINKTVEGRWQQMCGRKCLHNMFWIPTHLVEQTNSEGWNGDGKW